MTTEAWSSLKVGACSAMSMVSGVFATAVGAQAAKDWIPVFIIGVITAATPGFLAWLQSRKTDKKVVEVHTVVNSERTAMMAKVEAYHRDVLLLTAAKATADQIIKNNQEAKNIVAARAEGAAEEKGKEKP